MTAPARRRLATIPALHAAIRQRRFDEALKLAREGLRTTPGDGELWNALGIALRATGHPEAALACYGRALELAPADPAALGNLGNALKDLQRHAEAIAAHRRAVALIPTSTAWTNLGVACHDAGLLVDALAAFEEAIRLDPRNASAHFDRAQILLRRGDYAAGWSAFEWRWQLPERPPMPKYPTPLWDGRPLDGALLVWPEQGFGDSILSARFLPAVRKRVKRIVLGCKPELMRLFERIDGVDELVPIGKAVPPHVAHAPVMGLARHVMTSLATLPRPARLAAPRDAKARLAPLIAAAGKRLKVGIVWSGSVTFKGNAHRATGIERFLGFAEIPGVQLFSLQKGPRASELARAGAGDVVIDLAPELGDFADTAAAIELLDLVIMTDSSVAHLAGSLGRPIWNLLPCSAYWLYLEGRSDSPWYPSMRLFRQRRPGDWDGVFGEARSALAELARSHAAR